MSWDILDHSYPLLRAFGNLIELSFSEGKKRDEPDDLRSIDGLDRKSKDIRTHYPNYQLTSEQLHSAITIRRAPGESTIAEAPSEAVKMGLEALEQASDETDSLVVDALLSGHSKAVGIRYAKSANDEDGFATRFFHGRRFEDVEPQVLNWIQSSLENEVFDRERQSEDLSSLREPIDKFGKALKQSDSSVDVAGGENNLAWRVRAFASCL